MPGNIVWNSALSAEMRMSTVETSEPTYQRLTTACAAYGIKRSQAYQLAQAGLIKTFKIGKSRFVFLDSLQSLPERLAAPDENRDAEREGV